VAVILVLLTSIIDLTDEQKKAVESLREALDLLTDINAKDIAQSTLPFGRAHIAKTILQSMKTTLDCLQQ